MSVGAWLLIRLERPLVVVALVSVAGCGSTHAARAPQAPKRGPQAAVIYLSAKQVATTNQTGAGLSGTLHGDSRSGCLWLVGPNGSARQLRLVGPYTLDWYPSLTVYRAGKVFAGVGQKVALGGSASGGQPVPNCPVPGTRDNVLIGF